MNIRIDIGRCEFGFPLPKANTVIYGAHGRLSHDILLCWESRSQEMGTDASLSSLNPSFRRLQRCMAIRWPSETSHK